MYNCKPSYSEHSGRTGNSRPDWVTQRIYLKTIKNINKSKNEFRLGTFSLHVPMIFTLCILIQKETYSIKSTVGTYEMLKEDIFQTIKQKTTVFLMEFHKDRSRTFQDNEHQCIPEDTQTQPVLSDFYQKQNRGKAIPPTLGCQILAMKEPGFCACQTRALLLRYSLSPTTVWSLNMRVHRAFLSIFVTCSMCMFCFYLFLGGGN